MNALLSRFALAVTFCMAAGPLAAQDSPMPMAPADMPPAADTLPHPAMPDDSPRVVFGGKPFDALFISPDGPHHKFQYAFRVSFKPDLLKASGFYVHPKLVKPSDPPQPLIVFENDMPLVAAVGHHPQYFVYRSTENPQQLWAFALNGEIWKRELPESGEAQGKWTLFFPTRAVVIHYHP